MEFNCLPPSIVFQEVPNEISLCFSITGCKVSCKGCHSTELWNKNYGSALTNEAFINWLNKYHSLISCVVFFGGEWQPHALIAKLLIANNLGLKTCLYSGEKHIDIKISQHLNFLKTGAWQAELGGLESMSTNQVFRNVTSGEKLNHLFIKKHNSSSTHNSNLNPTLNTTSKGANNVAA